MSRARRTAERGRAAKEPALGGAAAAPRLPPATSNTSSSSASASSPLSPLLSATASSAASPSSPLPLGAALGALTSSRPRSPLPSYSSDATDVRSTAAGSGAGGGAGAKARSGGSRTHRRTLARQINLKEISEESEARARKKREEEEREREKAEQQRLTTASSSATTTTTSSALASPPPSLSHFTHQVRPVTQHGQWKAQHSVVLPAGADSSSDESEDDAEVEERERRRREADRDKEKEMRMHGLLPSIHRDSRKAAAPTAAQLPSVAPSHEAAAGGGGVGDYSGFHKKALKWQRRAPKEKAAAVAVPSSASREAKSEPAKQPAERAEEEGAKPLPKAASEDAELRKEAEQSKVKKSRKAEAQQPMRRVGVGAWKSQRSEESRVDDLLISGINGLGRAKEAPKGEEERGLEPQLPTGTAQALDGRSQLRPSAAVDAVVASSPAAEEERRWRESTTEKLSARRALVCAESSTSLESAPPNAGPLSEKALALLSSSSSLTSSLSRALASSGASLIAQADMEMRRAKDKDRERNTEEASQPSIASSPSSPRPPTSLPPPLSVPRLPPFTASTSSSTSTSRPSSRKLRRVEAAFHMDEEEVEELAVHSAAVLPLNGDAELGVGARLSPKTLTVGQELVVESWGEEGEELVQEETVLSLRTIDMPITHHTPSTATVLSNYLHDLSHNSPSSPSSLPPPPLSVHRLVQLPPRAHDAAAASADSSSSPSSAQQSLARSLSSDSPSGSPYEPSAEAILSYAECLGMDLPFDSDLLWIPRLALLHPLPSPWRCCESDGCIYFVHWGTGECSFTDPSDEFYASLYRSEKEHKWGDVIERIMDSSSVRRDGRLDFSSQRLDDVGMEVLSDMILGMGDMEDDRDRHRKMQRQRRRRRSRGRTMEQRRATPTREGGHDQHSHPQPQHRREANGSDAALAVVEVEGAGDDGGEGEGESEGGVDEEELSIPGFNAGLLLTSLDLSHNRVASAGCDTLLSSLSLSLHAPLSTLRLSSNQLTSDCCLLLSRYLQRNPYILELDLSNNESIGNMGAEHLARSLTSATSLRWMSMNKTGLNDFGCHYLCTGLTGHPALCTLDLQNNDIGVRGWKDLGRLAMTAHSLHDVRANGLRDAQHSSQLRTYIADADQQSSDPHSNTGEDAATTSSSSSALSPDAELVRSEVLLCLDANRDGALHRARLQRAVLSGLSGSSGDWCPLRRVFAVEAWAEKEEEDEQSPDPAPTEGKAAAAATPQRRRHRRVEGGRSSTTAKDVEVAVSGAQRRKGKGRVGGGSAAKRRSSSSAAVSDSAGTGKQPVGRSRLSNVREQATSGAAPLPVGVLVSEGGVRVRIGSVGIARQQGLADNALRQVWAFL